MEGVGVFRVAAEVLRRFPEVAASELLRREPRHLGRGGRERVRRCSESAPLQPPRRAEGSAEEGGAADQVLRAEDARA